MRAGRARATLDRVTIAITGANGHVGTHLRARLPDARPFTRHDALDLAGVNTVVHLAGTLAPKRPDTFTQANVDTLKATLAACDGRIVLLSYPGADPASPNAYLRAKGEAERLLQGRDAVIVRSTFIVGPPESRGPSATPLLGDRVFVIGSGRQRYAPVHVADVVETLARFATDAATASGTYALAGPETLTLDDLVRRLNGDEVKIRHLHPLAGRLLARLPAATVAVLAADSLPDASPLAADALGLELRRVR